MSYEEKMNELEKIIQKLENGEVKFDEATGLFEKGAQICKELYKEYDEAKGKITVIREELGMLLEENLK